MVKGFYRVMSWKLATSHNLHGRVSPILVDTMGLNVPISPGDGLKLKMTGDIMKDPISWSATRTWELNDANATGFKNHCSGTLFGHRTGSRRRCSPLAMKTVQPKESTSHIISLHQSTVLINNQHHENIWKLRMHPIDIHPAHLPQDEHWESVKGLKSSSSSLNWWWHSTKTNGTP